MRTTATAPRRVEAVIQGASAPRRRCLENSCTCARWPTRSGRTTFGVSILGANAGHADAANEEATTLTGHAVCIGIPSRRPHCDEAWRRVRGRRRGAAVEELRRKVYTARHAALYPKALVRRIRPRSAPSLTRWRVWKASSKRRCPPQSARSRSSLGTTPCSARGFTHSALERDERAKVFAADKEVGTAFAPNILRMSKLLDTSPTGKHAFYSEFVEMLVTRQGS